MALGPTEEMGEDGNIRSLPNHRPERQQLASAAAMRTANAFLVGHNNRSTRLSFGGYAESCGLRTFLRASAICLNASGQEPRFCWQRRENDSTMRTIAR